MIILGNVKNLNNVYYMDQQEAANLFENFTINYQNITIGEGQPGVKIVSKDN